VQVKVTILEKDEDLKPEMSAKVTFLEAQKKQAASAAPAPVVLVPQDAVVNRDGKSIVFIVREGKAVARTVGIGVERGSQVGIREGLGGGEVLVSHPPETLKDGDAIKVKQG